MILSPSSIFWSNIFLELSYQIFQYFSSLSSFQSLPSYRRFYVNKTLQICCLVLHAFLTNDMKDYEDSNCISKICISYSFFSQGLSFLSQIL